MGNVRDQRDWVRDFFKGSISRREFVERAATGGLGLISTISVLSTAAEARNHPEKERQRSKASLSHTSGRSRRADINQTNVNPYEEWLKTENIPVYRDYQIPDLRTVEVNPWQRLGVSGAYIDLVGGEGLNDAYLCEIASGASTTPQRSLFEEVIYILSGEGGSLIWNPGGGPSNRSNGKQEAFSPRR